MPINTSVIVPMLSVYRTQQHLRRLISKVRSAISVGSEFTDIVIRINPGDRRVFGVSPDNKVTIVLPTEAIELLLTNDSGSITMSSVDRMFLCPAKLTGLTLTNLSAVPVDVQIIHG